MSNESSEKALWTGRPTQLTALKFYVVCGLLAVAIITGTAYGASSGIGGLWFYALIALGVILLAAAIKYYFVRSTTYQLTSERLMVESGVFSRTTEELELYRVRDWSVIQPFWLRLAGRGHVRLMSNDASAPDLTLSGIIKPNTLRELLRTHVEAARDKKRVRHLDVDGGG